MILSAMGLTSRRWIIASLFLCAATVGNAAADTLQDFLVAEGFTSVKVLRRMGDNRVSVAVKINGHELKLLVDTGAPLTLISRQAADRCDLVVEKQVGASHGTNGIADEHAGFAKIDSFSISGVELNPAPVMISNFHFPYLFGNDFDGLLGLATMKVNNVIYGFAPNLFLLNPARPATYKLSNLLAAQGYGEIQPQLDRGHYLLPMVINGASAMMIFDSGAQNTVVSLDFAERERMATSAGRLFSSGMDGKQSIGKVITPTRLSIASRIIPTMPIAAVKMEIFQQKTTTSRGAVDGLLAFDLIGRMSPLLDIGNDRLYLRFPGGVEPRPTPPPVETRKPESTPPPVPAPESETRP